MSIARFFSTASATVVSALPDGSAVAFDLSGPHGGVWTLRRRGPRIEVERFVEPPIDCTLTCSIDDFGALIQGDLDPTQAFLAGRLRIEGDIGLVLDLQAALR